MFRSRLGKFVAVSAMIAAAAYWASPYVAVSRFAQAVDRGDTAAVLERLDLLRLRISLARQIVRAYPVSPALIESIDPAARHAAGLVAVTYLEAVIAENFPPEAILRVLNTRSGAETAGNMRISLPPARALGGAWDIFLASGFSGPVSFTVEADTDTGASYRLGLRFIGGTWRLVSLGLPSEVVQQAVARLKARAAGR
jgi:hypothetical protein